MVLSQLGDHLPMVRLPVLENPLPQGRLLVYRRPPFLVRRFPAPLLFNYRPEFVETVSRRLSLATHSFI